MRYVVQRSACSLHASLLGVCGMTYIVYSYGWGLIALTAGELFTLGFVDCPNVVMRVNV